MPTLHIPNLMKFYVNNQTELLVEGFTIAEALSDLTIRYPAIKFHIFDDQGKLRRYINLFVNTTNITDLDGLQTAIKENDKITLLPSISGG
jgi:adenylyltransferase/sulfurtransferase